MTGLSQQIDKLIGAIAQGRAGVLAPIEYALQDVPRHHFIPVRALVADAKKETVIDREKDPVAWWDAVYSEESILTQLDDGATPICAGDGSYTSSNSAPAARQCSGCTSPSRPSTRSSPT